MKKNKKLWILLVSTVVVLIAGCEKENENQANNTSGGIVTQDDAGIELNLDNNSNEEIRFDFHYYTYYEYESRIAIWHDDFRLRIGSTNNFQLAGSGSISITKFGNVSGISAITSVPSSGWVREIAVNPGSGYVVRYRGAGFNYTYARIYVKSWITNTLGEIIGATIVYQDNWGKEQESPNLAGCEYVSSSNKNIVFNSTSTGTLNGNNFTYTIEERHGFITTGGQSHQFYLSENDLILEIDGTVIWFEKIN